MIKPHWNLHYLRARLTQKRFFKANPDLPWLSEPAVSVFRTLLKPADHMIEFGCGRSTLWFSKRVASLISVEHQKGWADKVKDQLKEAGVRNAEVRYFEAPYKEEGPESLKLEYVCWMDRLDDASVDAVLVDGGCRGAAALKAIPKIRPGGVLAIDNVNWYLPSETLAPASRSPSDGPYNEIWKQVWDILAGWRHVWASDDVNDTAFFIKPCETE